MPDDVEGGLSTEVIRRRTRRFASLRAAQRALSRSVHPSELAQANEHGRQLVIQIQALGAHARDGSGAAPAEADLADRRADLEQIDQLLDEISTRTHAILDGVDISQLRSIVPVLAAEHPEEVRGLIDVLLDGDLESDKNLRTLEYLVTVLCSEERDGRRFLVREPGEVSERLQELGRTRLTAAEGDPRQAENTFRDALRTLPEASEIGEIRDQIRHYKERLGSGVLHPRVLSAAVSYNVAMWNQVAGLIEGSRSIDRLADELLDFSSEGSDHPATRAAGDLPRSSDPTDVLGSAAFARIVAALQSRVRGGQASDELARRLVGTYRIERLDPVEIEAFETDDDEPSTRLTRAAVALGLTIRHAAELADALGELRIDPDALKTRCVAELMAEMTAAARKLFTESRYDDAFRLSEIKTRNLAAIATGPERTTARPSRRPEHGAARAGPTQATPGGLARILQLDWLPSGQARALLLFGALLLAAAVYWSPGSGVAVLSSNELARVSPFLDTGYRSEQEDGSVFVGRLHPTWDYLEPHQRLLVAREIGQAFQQRGVAGVVLEDRWKRVQARYRDGRLLEGTPVTNPPAPGP
jgi:hypothetical protein